MSVHGPWLVTEQILADKIQPVWRELEPYLTRHWETKQKQGVMDIHPEGAFAVLLLSGVRRIEVRERNGIVGVHGFGCDQNPGFPRMHIRDQIYYPVAMHLPKITTKFDQPTRHTTIHYEMTAEKGSSSKILHTAGLDFDVLNFADQTGYRQHRIGMKRTIPEGNPFAEQLDHFIHGVNANGSVAPASDILLAAIASCPKQETVV